MIAEVWISLAQLNDLPMSGPGWDDVVAKAAVATVGLGDLSNQNDSTDVYTMAKALVYARTGQESYRTEVIDTITAVMGTEGQVDGNASDVLAWTRNISGYVIAGDLVGLPAGLDATWRQFLDDNRFENWGNPRNTIEAHEIRPNSRGTTAGVARMVIAKYLGDDQDLAQAAIVFEGWLTGAWPHEYGDDHWRVGVVPPRGINPVGHEWDGVLPDDQRRHGSPPGFECDPGSSQYPLSALQGVVAQAHLYEHYGFGDPWSIADSAIRRAFERWTNEGCVLDGDDRHVAHRINHQYDLGLPEYTGDPPGKLVDFYAWTHAGDGGAVDPCFEQVAIGPPPVKIAYVGDCGNGPDTMAVLALCETEGASAVVHTGDFDYEDDPAGWLPFIRQNWDTVNRPYVAVVGNHESCCFTEYSENCRDLLLDAGMAWDGNVVWNSTDGQKYSVDLFGIRHVMTTPGLTGSGHDAYVTQRFAGTDFAWRVSGWHLLQEEMQIGGKWDQAGWEIYEATREAGAICATAHEHSYQRTNLLSQMEDPESHVVGTDLVLSEGETFAFVSGIGGLTIRDQERCFPDTAPYGCNGVWASIWTLNQGAVEHGSEGALFIEYRYQDDPCLARGYFMTVDGTLVDEFFVTSAVGECAGPPPCTWDLDGDGSVGVSDMLDMFAEWGTTYCVGDLIAMFKAWGPCPS